MRKTTDTRDHYRPKVDRRPELDAECARIRRRIEVLKLVQTPEAFAEIAEMREFLEAFER